MAVVVRPAASYAAASSSGVTERCLRGNGESGENGNKGDKGGICESGDEVRRGVKLGIRRHGAA